MDLIRQVGVVLDIGTAYTKFGMAQKNAPKKIIKTPSTLFTGIKNIDILKPMKHLSSTFYDKKAKKQEENKDLQQEQQTQQQQKEQNQQKSSKINVFEKYKEHRESIIYPLQQMLQEIFYNELLIQPNGKTIYICESFLTPRIFQNILADLLFNIFQFEKVYFLLSNSLPLYLTQTDSGIVVETKYYDSSITHFYDGYPLVESFTFEQVGGYKMNYALKTSIVERLLKINNILDQEVIQKISELKEYQSLYKYLDFKVIEDIKFKYCKILSKKQSEEFFSSEEKIEAMKKQLVQFKIISGTNLQKILISFYDAVYAGEQLFGNVDKDQSNIAYTFLKSLLKLDKNVLKKSIKNVVFAGGASQTQGFSSRFREEILYFLNNRKEFQKIKHIEDEMQFPHIKYPCNCLNWIGGSVIGSLSDGDNFLVTSQQYKENGCEIYDNFGQNILQKISDDSDIINNKNKVNQKGEEDEVM